MPSPQEHLASLLNQVENLGHRDEVALDALRRRAEMVVRNIFGETSKYLKDLDGLNFHPMVYPADEEYYNSTWTSGEGQLKNLIATMREELELFGTEPQESIEVSDESGATKGSSKVFIVHGHDEAAKLKVARFVEQLGLEAVILHERLDSGQTIIEKFERESHGVGFAIVLLTADDVGSTKDSTTGLNPRARQNVVFELGYFIGKFGRSKVAALREPTVEMPSDYSGIVDIEFGQTDDGWKLRLAREIKGAVVDVDLNKAV